MKKLSERAEELCRPLSNKDKHVSEKMFCAFAFAIDEWQASVEERLERLEMGATRVVQFTDATRNARFDEEKLPARYEPEAEE